MLTTILDNQTFLKNLSNGDTVWPPGVTYLISLNLEPYSMQGLEVFPDHYVGDHVPMNQNLGQIFGYCNQTIQSGAQTEQPNISVALGFLMRAAAKIFMSMTLGSLPADLLQDIQQDLHQASDRFEAVGDTIAISWSKFLSQLAILLSQPATNVTSQGEQFGRGIADLPTLSKTVANVLIRCVYLLLRRRKGPQQSGNRGDSDGIKRLLLWGKGLCQSCNNSLVLAQIHANYGRLFLDDNDTVTASDHYLHAFRFAMCEERPDVFLSSFKLVVDRVLHSLSSRKTSSELSQFYEELETSWTQRFPQDDSLHHWRKQDPIWSNSRRMLLLAQSNKFLRARKLAMKIYKESTKLPPEEAEQALYKSTKPLMEYGPIELAQEAIKKLDAEPYNIFGKTEVQWQSDLGKCQLYFTICVERWAFENCQRFLRRLEKTGLLSANPADHHFKDCENLLIHAARAYIEENKLHLALELLICCCTLINNHRESISDSNLRQKYFAIAHVEHAFDLMVWVCLSLHKTGETAHAAMRTTSGNWAEEALYYADMGKARHLRDVMQKQRLAREIRSDDVVEHQPKDREDVRDDVDLLSNLSKWLNPTTLVIHLSLKHEGLGIICANSAGIHEAVWNPSWGTWDAEILISKLFSTIQDPNFRERLETQSAMTNGKLNNLLEDLSIVLVKPIEELLDRLTPKTLCFVPAGSLARVPFAALHYKQTVLVERFSIHQVPSLAVLRELCETEKLRHSKLERIGVIAQSSHEAQDLSATVVECVDVVDQYQDVSSIVDAKVTESEDLLDLYGQCDLLFVGTHGHSNYDNPWEWSLALGKSFHVDDLAGVKSRAKLIFFSACFSGLGVSTVTDDMIGFQAQVLESGALGFAGFLWNVDALASLYFTHLFCKELQAAQRQKATIVDAFSATQRTLRKLTEADAEQIVQGLRERWNKHKEKNDLPPGLLADGLDFFSENVPRTRQDFKSPYFWAPFMLVGCPTGL